MSVKNILALGLLLLIFCSTTSYGEENSSKEYVNKQLIAAVQKGDEKAVEQLLKQGANPNTGRWKRTVDGKVDIHAPYNNLWIDEFEDVLYKAINVKNPNIVKLLITNGANVNATYNYVTYNLIDTWIYNGYENKTPLILAIEMTQWDIVYCLIESNADINAVCKKYNGYGPDPYKTATIYGSVLDYALREKAPDNIMDLLKSKGALTYKEIEEREKQKKGNNND